MEKNVSIKEIQQRIQAIDNAITEKMKLVKAEYQKRKTMYHGLESLNIGEQLTIANMNAISYKNMQDCINTQVEVVKLYASMVKSQGVSIGTEPAAGGKSLASQDIEAIRNMIAAQKKQ